MQQILAGIWRKEVFFYSENIRKTTKLLISPAAFYSSSYLFPWARTPIQL
jgi:hypothetical protein